MSELSAWERPAAGQATGLLVLHHGRGADERDLAPLADVLDPQRRLHVVSVRGPLILSGSPGYHWYIVRRVGFPDAATFQGSTAELAEFHDELWQRTGTPPGRTVLAGFSMGAVMSYSLGLGVDRPAPAGILAFSGFLPTVEGWAPQLEDRLKLPVFIAHGRLDPTIPVQFARQAQDQLSQAGLPIAYHESDVGHSIDPNHAIAARAWLADTIS